MKIIATDYDGTLNHGGIDDAKREAVAKWQQKGNLFVVVTGRDMRFCPEMHRKSGIAFDYYLACNGALIMDKEFGIIEQVFCDSAVLDELLSYLFELGCQWGTVCSQETVVIANPQTADDDADAVVDINAYHFTYFNQVSTALPTFEDARRVTEAVARRFAGILNPLQNGTCIDIVPVGMDKAQGIRRLLSVCGARESDVVTVGDNVNDLAMIRAFRSYAMQNGVDEVKQAADGIVLSVTELIETEMQEK